MKKVVFKYFIPIRNDAGTKKGLVVIPIGADIIRIGHQHNNPCIWAAVNPEEKQTEEVEIEMYGTGEIINGYHVYVGSVEFFGQEEIYHFYIKPK